MSDYYKDTFNAIKEYADNDTEYGWHTCIYEQVKYRFPKRALIWYAFGKMSSIHDKLPKYEPISERSTKMWNDNQYHTDCIIGSGFDLENDNVYGSKVNNAIYTALIEIEEELKDLITFDFTILSNGLDIGNDYGLLSGMVYDYDLEYMSENVSSNISIFNKKRIKHSTEYRTIVIPHAGIEYDLVAQNADIIITELGGKLSHLATVSREKGKLLIRMDNGVERFGIFTRFRLNLNDYTFTLRD